MPLRRDRPVSEMVFPGFGPSPTSPTAAKEPPLARLCAQVDLHLGCSRCTQRLNESTYLLRAVEHSCPRQILLARSKRATKRRVWRKVDRRPSFPQPLRYEVCRYYRPGVGCRRHYNQCTFARSPEEALVWNFEREHNLSRLWLKAAVQGGGAQGELRSPADAIYAEFGGQFQLLCSCCFRRYPPRLCPVDPPGWCSQHGACPSLLVHVSTEGRRRQQVVEVRPRPQYSQPLAYCMFVGRGRPCRHGASRCQYAHSAVEMAVWEAEQLSGLRRGDLLMPPAPAGNGHTAPHSQPPRVRLYCRVCLVTCHSQEAFENHCSSVEHAHMVALDQAVPWKHRSPPTGLSTFELCPRPDLCEYGVVCTKAHSEQELQEWVSRVQTVELREKAAWQEGLVPYQVRLLAEYRRSSSEISVLAETVDGVSITCNQPLVHQAQEKKTEHSWMFTIHSEEPLLHVALLKQEPGADFSLEAPCLPRGQVYAEGERFCVPGSRAEFQVGVCVQSASFGTFEQWVVFDFGRRPALLRKLGLQLGQVHCTGLQGTPVPGHPMELERWHPGNRHVVPSVARTAEQVALMAKYKVPALALEFSRSGPAPGPISCTNYRQRMHQFLYEEEAAQQQLVAKLNLRGPVSLKTALQTPALGMLFPPPGALYAQVPIPSSLTPDTDQGFLLSRAVSTALVAPVPAPDHTVFEVRLETRASSEQALWLLLPAQCCTALGLQPEASPVLEVQFQIDPLTFRLWHQAVDALPEERLVVPDLLACTLPCPWPTPPALHGNRKQRLAVEFIVGSNPGGTQPIAPLLIYGPFGTGKTYTLAMASLEVIRQPHTKVLICTHTNSAADIYIEEHFHGYVSSGHPEAAPLRVMYTDRPPSQTDAATLQYCCLTEDRRAFRPPTQAELEQHRIVITTTSQARELRVPAGFFSHILIDEAAQMLECEALTPLRYALPSTRVVLAGDHMQVTPRLFSVARAQAAGHTLLHRLFQHYQQQTHEVARRSRLVFHENYRSTEAIISFISHHFYVAKGNPIHASGRVPRHPRHYPLMFCHVAGSPERDMSMTSWLNTAEIAQVVEKVQEIHDTWPRCWGSREQKHICAVSHGAQVSALRQELRKRGLGQVSVGSFEILPGREFRVVVLSTVHNHRSLLGPGAPALEFFTDARVLNTVMTRAQSQVVAVGDAVALCSFGDCSKLWKSFIRECVEHRSVFPEDLSLEQIKQGVVQRQRWDLHTERSVAVGAVDTVLEQGAAGGPTTEHTAVAKVKPGAVAEEGASPSRTSAAEDVATQKAEAGDTVSGSAAGGLPAAEGAAPVHTQEGDTASAGNLARGDVAPRDATASRSKDPEDSESDFWPSDGELDADDSLLQELLDESRNVTVTVGEDGLLDTIPRPASPQQARQYVNLPQATLWRLLREEPELYRHCAFTQETFERATAVPLDGAGPGPIQVRGRLNCGMAFTGDEVLVKVFGGAAGDRGPTGRLQGRVVGVLKRRCRELVFVCRMDEWDPRIMTPIDGSVTKIFVAELKDPLQVPIHRLLQGHVQRVRYEPLTAKARRDRLFRVRVVLWRERFYYPLGIVLEVLPQADTWQRGLHALDLEFGLRDPSPDPASVSKALQKFRAELGRRPGCREDCRGFLTFTVDPQGARSLDDALSVRDLGPRYEVAVHITDVASVMPRDSGLDVEARRQGTSFYAPDREPVPMLPTGLCQDVFSLLPGQDRLAISLFLTVEKGSDQVRGLRFAPSMIRSNRQLSYEEAEQVIKGHPGAGLELPARLDSVDACVAAACHLSRVLRRRRLQGDCHYKQLDEDSMLGFRAAHVMVQEYMIQFNRLAAEFLVGSERTRTVTPLRWQPMPSSRQLEAVREKHGGLVPLSLHLRHHLCGPGPPDTHLHLLASLWRHVQLAARAQDFDGLVDLITTDDVHPSLAPAGLDFRRALGRSVFGRSSQGEQQPASHYSLQVEWYTWATSPIRRYLDVVLQRQILLALGQGGSAYSPRDIDGLCQDFSHQHMSAQRYQRRAYSLHLATRLKAQPQDKLGFVVDVEHVKISWDAERTPQGQLQGTFCLEAAFLREHCIDISLDHCYLCIRLEGLPAVPDKRAPCPPGSPGQPPSAAPPRGPSSLSPILSIDPDTYTWVAHGLTEDGDLKEGRADRQEARKQVHFFIHHMAMEKVPEEVLRPGSRFTIEVLPKQLPDLRKEEAVRDLESASPLVISIALGQPIPLPRCPPHQQPLHRGTPRRFLERQAFDIPGSHHKLNPSQKGAIREALRKQFTVIQGPPGTGKTVVALHLVFWFHKSNEEQALACGSPGGETRLGGPCILYCGPSNKSVDVLAGLLLSRRAELKPLRVYSEQAEATEFPAPGVGSRGPPKNTPREGRPNQTLRSITLHHRIRQPSNPYASDLKAFDARLQKGEVFSKEDLLRYRRTLGKARKFELDRHRVILCTCSCAASVSLKNLDVRQILVDEAGMATEPETLIPLVTFSRAEKVVLLGDHKQLRPVVKNEQLQNLGLDRSLFERYHRDAYMLDTQYRMHRDICTFPSMEFYKGKLKTWHGLRRPPSVLGHADKESCPVIFGYVQGHEQSLLVSTDEGNENSKANLEEVAEVVRIAKQLTLGRTVDPKDIAILTPYNAQATEISKRLVREGITGVTVCSITKSQGSEWRYVLVSTVRTRPESDVDQRPTKGWLKKFLGFVVDPNQVNVAITRAQEGLCLIGDHLLLRCCPLWRRLLDSCEAQQSLVPAGQVRVQRRPAVSF
uniref:3'-5' exoribonuclease HELZ2 n=1 Tax=Equus caballus TaxID=9796 RepID=A0A3Q2KMV1_HORSE